MYKNKNVYIFVPHQDDEVAIWPVWQKILHAKNIYIFCVTNGEQRIQVSDGTRELRNLEAIRNLTTNGINKKNIFFLSNKMPPNDQLLHNFLGKVLEKLSVVVKKLEAPDIVVFPACEGGHPDHDVTNLLVRVFCKTLSKSPIGHEYFSYSLSNRLFPFNFARPDIIEPDMLKLCFPRSELKSVIRVILNYKSQQKTFMILGPSLILSWALRPRIYFRAANMENTRFERPVNSKILYEKRKWVTFKHIQNKLRLDGFI